MQRIHASVSCSKRSRERGVALIVTLLLLLLVTAMSLAMVLSVNSDMLINGYYRNFRGSFYAADSGVNIVRADLAQQLIARAGAFSTTAQPFAPGTDAQVVSAINAKYASNYFAVTGSGQGSASSSWPARFKINTLSNNTSAANDYFYQLPDPAGCTVLGGGGTCSAPTGGNKVTGYRYVFAYAVTAIGQSQGNEAATITDRGTITIVAPLVPAGPQQTKFSAWGMFIDQNTICSAPYVPGTITGPVFTNGSWTFGDTGSYIFTDAVGSAGAKAGYMYSDGHCNQVAGPNDKYKNTTIAPQFQGGLNLSQPSVPLPGDDFDQREAVLDGIGDGRIDLSTSSARNTAFNSKLRNISGTAYPTGGASSGVYLPYTMINGVPTFTGGGIYVEGNANVTLTAGTSSSGQPVQIYGIVQGGTATTITINNVANTTTVVSGGTVLNITGVPQQIDGTTLNPVAPGTMLYVNGNINSLTGPSSGAAVQDASAVTVTAAGDVTITGNLTYNKKPVTTTQNEIPNQIPNAPIDTLIPNNDTGQVLGIYTNSGNINFKASSNNQNIEVDAALATISDSSISGKGTGGLQILGPYTINTLNIIGARVNNRAYTTSYLRTRNIYFDRRFSQNGFGPPWFPSTSVSPGGMVGGPLVPTFQRVQWLNETSYQ